MIKLLASIIVSLCLTASSQTWTFHAVKDNATWVSIYGPSGWMNQFGSGPYSSSLWAIFATWDLGWDVANPSSAYSGLEVETMQEVATDVWTFVPVTNIVEWIDTWTVSAPAFGFPDGVQPMTASGILSGPYPNYSGGGTFDISLLGGEWWIDFDSVGTVRVSSSQPSDFGKWAWDGSINPDYIAPLLTRKHHVKK